MSEWIRESLQTNTIALDDAALAEVVAASNEGRFEQAGERASELWREGMHDVRLLSYLLHGQFVAQGPAVLHECFSSCMGALDGMSEVGPERMREAHFDKRLAWLFRTCAQNMRCRGTAQDLGRAWPRTLELALRAHALERASALGGALTARGMSEANGALSELMHELRSVPAAAPGESKVEESEEEEVPNVAVSAPSVKGVEASLTPAELTPSARVVRLEVSESFVVLCAKMRAFRALIERRKFERAAVVADDVHALLEGFDPLLYFPGLFRDYASDLAAHVGEILPCWQEREGVEWAMLRQLYRASPAAFAEE